MTPKEKADGLVDKYSYFEPNTAKQCALIAVNEIISSNPHSNPLNTNVESTMEYWQQVKQEIEAL